MLVDRLKTLLKTLEELDPYPWTAVEAWRARALPLVRESLPGHMKDFEDVTKTPNGLSSDGS